MSIESDKKISYMNYMKFFGIIYLLIWHTGIQHLNIIVILFFLQMFFFISGYFYKDVYSEKPFMFLQKRIKTLYAPFVIYCSMFLCLNNLFVSLNIYKNSMYIPWIKFNDYFLQILILQPDLQMAGAMWFVSSLFFASILFCGISAILKKIACFNNFTENIEYIRFFLITALFLFGNYLSFRHIWLHSFMDVSLVLLIFYYFGYLYKKHEQQIPLNIYIALSAFMTLLIGTKFGLPIVSQRQYVGPTFILLNGIVGIYLNIYISKKCMVFQNIQFVNYVGNNTMIILALHFLAFKLVSIIIIFSQNLPVIMLSSFPVIETANIYYRWLYVISGIILPLSGKYLFDMGRCRLKSFFASGQAKKIA